MTDFEAYKAAFDELKRLITHDDDCARNKSSNPPGWTPNVGDDLDRVHHIGIWAPDDEHDTADVILRQVLCCLEHDPEATLRVETTNHYASMPGYFNDAVFTYPGSQLRFFRDFMDVMDYTAEEQHYAATISGLIETMIGYDFSRDAITHLATMHSLCPIHFCDWAICFDDEPPECSQIRTIYPYSHDT